MFKVCNSILIIGLLFLPLLILIQVFFIRQRNAFLILEHISRMWSEHIFPPSLYTYCSELFSHYSLIRNKSVLIYYRLPEKPCSRFHVKSISNFSNKTCKWFCCKFYSLRSSRCVVLSELSKSSQLHFLVAFLPRRQIYLRSPHVSQRQVLQTWDFSLRE